MQDAMEKDSHRLTHKVRQQYVQYLIKTLCLNWETWLETQKKADVSAKNSEANKIKECASILEDEALQECMVAPIYQRSMCRILSISPKIADVRSKTRELKLMDVLQKSMKNGGSDTTKPKISVGTQTEIIEKSTYNDVKSSTANITTTCDNNAALNLDERILLFQKHLSDIENTEPTTHCSVQSPRLKTKRRKKMPQLFYEPKKQCATITSTNNLAESNSPGVRSPNSGTFSTDSSQNSNHFQEKIRKSKQLATSHHAKSSLAKMMAEDEVAKNLAEMFTEEKTEFDEIFGFDPNNEPENPEMMRILELIENARTPEGNAGADEDMSPHVHAQHTYSEEIEEASESPRTPPKLHVQEKRKQHSVLPCVIFRLKRQLSERLNELVDLDMRLYEAIKLKFFELFGEDSDDEFGAYSPSTDLTEELIDSCIYRISRWMVKYLMRPLHDNLISNRFLFKKLAKRLARLIILYDYYPDERFVKTCVESFFCVVPSVRSVDDINIIDNLLINAQGDLSFTQNQ